MRWMKSDSGQSVVEFALVLPMLLAVCIGMAELGRATWAWNMAQMAAAEGARRAIVIGGKDVGGNTVYAWKDSAIAGSRGILWGKDQRTEKMISGVTITPTLDKTTTPYLVTVNVDIPVRLLMDFWSQRGYIIHGHATMPVQPAFDAGP